MTLHKILSKQKRFCHVSVKFSYNSHNCLALTEFSVDLRSGQVELALKLKVTPFLRLLPFLVLIKSKSRFLVPTLEWLDSLPKAFENE